MAALHLEQVTKIYRKGDNEVRALDGVDLDIEAGEFLTIVGPSGSGKTTLLNILGCLDSPTQGRMIYDGQELRYARREEPLRPIAGNGSASCSSPTTSSPS